MKKIIFLLIVVAILIFVSGSKSANENFGGRLYASTKPGGTYNAHKPFFSKIQQFIKQPSMVDAVGLPVKGSKYLPLPVEGAGWTADTSSPTDQFEESFVEKRSMGSTRQEGTFGAAGRQIGQIGQFQNPGFQRGQFQGSMLNRTPSPVRPEHPIGPERPPRPGRPGNFTKPADPVRPIIPVYPVHPVHPVHPVRPISPVITQPIYYPVGTPGSVVVYDGNVVPIVPSLNVPGENQIGFLVNNFDQMYLPLYRLNTDIPDRYIFYAKSQNKNSTMIPIHSGGINCLERGGCPHLANNQQVYIPRFDRNFRVVFF